MKKISRRRLLATGLSLTTVPTLSGLTTLSGLSGLSALSAGLSGCRTTPHGSPTAHGPVARPVGEARRVRLVVAGTSVTDGAGVRLSRSLGSSMLPLLDPFLMLDEFRSENPGDYIAGFPSHPHRGFETVTYMLDGAMEHRDSLGNRGLLGPGSMQWMTAGHGIVHSEMPRQVSGLMHGFQLWVNLPRAQKLIAPRYQDLPAGRLASLGVEDAEVKLIAGAIGETRGPVDGIVTEPHMLDVLVPPRGRFEHLVPRAHNAFAYVIDGAVRFESDGADVGRGQLAVLERGDRVAASSRDGGRFLLLAGRPIGEPVARRGPFVMNTEAELDQAIREYQTGVLTTM